MNDLVNSRKGGGRVKGPVPAGGATAIVTIGADRTRHIRQRCKTLRVRLDTCSVKCSDVRFQVVAVTSLWQPMVEATTLCSG